tara:strand:- start:42 stop:362 length:321 start_codon:yes stop_codon:yes gene_type:complete
MTQFGALQAMVALETGLQGMLQPPQWARLGTVASQLVPSPSQSRKPVSQLVPQVEAEQVGVALSAPAQVVPQPPQLPMSLVRSTHVVSPSALVHEVWPASQSATQA